MNKQKNNFLMLILIGTMLMLSFIVPVQGATYTYYYENFGSPDADGQNPVSSTGEIPYTYAEFGWSGGTAGVDASSQYYINTSTTGADGWANFTFNTSYAYDYFEFKFEYINSWTTWRNHSGLEFRLSGNVGDICFVQIYGANTTVGDSANRLKLLDYNGVEVANVSLTQGQWYTVRLNPDYDSWDDNIQVTVYDNTGTTYIVDETLDLNGNSAISKFYMDEQPNAQKVCMILDNFVLVQTTYTQSDTTTNYLAEYIFPIMFAIAMLIIIISLLVSGATIPALITTIIIALLGIVVISILTAI